MIRLSLRLRLTLQVSVLFALALLVVGWFGRNELRSRLNDDAQATAAAILAAYVVDDPARGGMLIEPSADEVSRFVYIDETGVEVSERAFGQVVLDQLDERVSEDFDLIRPEMSDQDAGGPIGRIDVGQIEYSSPIQSDGPTETVFINNTLTLLQPIRVGDAPMSVGVSIPQRPIDDSVKAVTTLALALVPLLTALVAGSTWIATGRTLRPVEAIRRHVARTDQTLLERHVPRSHNDDEIDRLAATMNSMLDRLHRASEKQRQFVSDASHELRSPITASITEIETTPTHTIESRWPELSQTLLERQHHLSRLVADLLLLATLDEHQARLADPTPIDLDDVALTIVDRRAEDQLDVRVHVTHPQRIEGDPTLIERCLSNLVENAMRHATRHVVVTVSTNPSGYPMVAVEDDGPGIALEHRETVFDRFARLDVSRTASTGGAGLGLSIARTIAEEHNATLIVSEAAIGGARFELTFL